mmetsp:Transcript_35345/g.51935  ORF Transcript_35345/g.51935 Transcript_35345/m.51935 type:complete len:100 (-) Transcript_35345:25-324(-)
MAASLPVQANMSSTQQMGNYVGNKFCAVCGGNKPDHQFVTDMSEFPVDLRDASLCIACHTRKDSDCGGICPSADIAQRLREQKAAMAAGVDPTFKYGDA